MIRLAIERPVSTIVGTVTLLCLGLFSLFRLPVALLPSVDRPRLTVVTRAPDKSKEEMVKGVTEPLERRILSILGVREVLSETQDGVSRILVDTEWGSDVDRMRIDVARRIEGVATFATAEQTVTVEGEDVSPIVRVMVASGKSIPLYEQTQSAEEILIPDISRISGVGRVELVGGEYQRVVIHPNLETLAASKLTVMDLVSRLSSLGLMESGGQVRNGSQIVPVKVGEPADSVERIQNAVISNPDGDRIFLNHLADIRIEQVPAETAFHHNGEQAVLIRVFRAPDANAMQLAREVGKVVSSASARLQSRVNVSMLDDRSVEIAAAIREILTATGLGILLGTILLWYVLGSWRPTAALSIVVPVSLLTAFSAFYLFDIPLDIVSLSGLALAAGMLVDNAIVVLEAIERNREQDPRGAEERGTLEVARAVVASALTTMVVFVPFLYLRGLARAFFGEQAFAAIASLGASLVFSLTLTPVLSRRSQAATRGRQPGQHLYLRLLNQAIRKPALTTAISLGVLLITISGIFAIHKELFPQGASNTLVVDYTLPGQTDLVRSESISLQVLASLQDFTKQFGPVGIDLERGLPESALSSDTILPERGRFFLHFTNNKTAFRAQPLIAAFLNQMVDVHAEVRIRPNAFLEIFNAGNSAIEVTLSTPDPERSTALAEEVRDDIRKKTGFVADLVSDANPIEGYQLKVDDASLLRYGLARQSLASQVRAALTDQDIGQVDIQGVSPKIRVAALNGSDILGLPVGPAVDGKLIPLGVIAETIPQLLPDRIIRVSGRPSARIRFQKSDSTFQQVSAVQKALASYPFRPDESFRLGGEALEISSAYSELLLAFGLSILLVYLTLAAMFESVRLPLLIMVTVPIACGGAITALLITGQSINMMSFLGLIVLGGIVVNNAIVLVDRIESRRRMGMSYEDSVLQAATERYRPILLTKVITFLGMLPLALLGGEGAELRRPMAIAILGGLFTSFPAALLAVPVFYRRFCKTEKALQEPIPAESR